MKSPTPLWVGLSLIIAALIGWSRRLTTNMSPPQPMGVSRAPNPIDPSKLSSQEILWCLTVVDPDRLKRGIELARWAFDDEEKRRTGIEAKATTLISALGIAVSLVVSGGGLLLGDPVKHFATIWSMLLITFFFLGVLFLVLALLSALRSVRVAFHARPDPNEFVEIQNDPPVEIDRNVLAGLLTAYNRNSTENNTKAGYLKDAHLCMKIAAISLLCSATTISGYLAWSRLVNP